MRLTRELRSPLTPALMLLAAALFFGGGAGDSSLPWLGGAAALLALVLFASGSPPGGLVAMAPLLALALWCVVSITWSIEPDRSWNYANRTLVYAAFALVGALLGVESRRLLYGVSALLGAVCVWSLAGKALPWLYEDYGRIARLRGPVGYWNGLALLGDIALPLGLCLATRLRVSGALLVYGWLVVIGLTYSRGGVVVAVIVVALWAVATRNWAETLATLLAAGLPAAGALAVAFSLSGVTSDGAAHGTRVRDGLVFGAVLLADGVIVAALARVARSAVSVWLVRRAALGLLALGAAAAVAVSVVHARGWWHSFQSSTEVTNSSNRLLSSGSNFRWSWWAQAWRGWKADPIQGTGAGSFEFTNLRYRTSNLDETVEPHDLPVQFLSETGIVGLLLFGAAVAWLIRAGKRKPGPQLALALALPALFLHGLLDIDWDFVAVSAPVFLIAGALVAQPSSRPRPRLFTVMTATGVALAAVFSLFAVWLGNRWNDQAGSLLGIDNAKAIRLATRARTVDPLSIYPLLNAADAELSIGFGQYAQFKKAYRKGDRKESRRLAAAYRHTNSLALGYFTKATEIQPDSAFAWASLGSYYQSPFVNCDRAAYDAFNRATVLDGQNLSYIEAYETTLKAVNSGKPKC